MGEETTNAVNGTVKTEEQQKTGKKKNYIPVIIVAVVIIAILGVVLYLNSDGVQRRKAMEEGDRYLSGMQYEQALACYQAALNIDVKHQEKSPDVAERMEGIIGEAEEFVGNGEYEKAIDVVDKLLVISSDNPDIQKILTHAEEIKKEANDTINGNDYLEQADLAFIEGRYDDAVVLYDLVVESLQDEELVEPKRTLANIYQKLIALWEAGDYQGVAEYMDSSEFDPVIDHMQIDNPQFVTCKDNLIIILKDDNLYVTGGELTKDISDGQETAVIVTANRYTLFSGQMKNGEPDGDGEFIIWSKGKDITSGAGLKGEISKGIFSGIAYYSNGTYSNIPIGIDGGKLGVVKVDNHDRYWLSDTDEEGRYYYINGNDYWVNDYISGVPGYGGTDDIFELMDRYLDTVPPVFTCTAHVGDDHFSTNQVKASDNVDGDVTSSITVTKKETGDREWGKITYTFTVSDEDGNTKKMTVTVEHGDMCGEKFNYVESVSY